MDRVRADAASRSRRCSQSFLRTKTARLAAFLKVARAARPTRRTTPSTPTQGRRSPTCTRSSSRGATTGSTTRRPVDGSDPATDWKGCTPLADAPQVMNPANGWVFNTNNWPYSAAGPRQPEARGDFPRYMDTAGENPRGVHAHAGADRAQRDFTLEGAAAPRPTTRTCRPSRGSSPRCVAAYDAAPAADPLKAQAGRARSPRCAGWDCRWSAASEPDLAGGVLGRGAVGQAAADGAAAAGMNVYDYMADARPPRRQLRGARRRRPTGWTRDFGSWRTPWGEINRFQRLTGDIVQTVPRRPAPASPCPSPRRSGARWPRSARARYPGTKRYYGTSGNSFVAVVEFGPRVRALRGDRRRRERRPRVAPLQRPGRALRRRRPARGLLLPRPARGPHRAHLPSGRVLKRTGLTQSQRSQRS